MIAKRWQDQINALFGLWIMISPWSLAFGGGILSATAVWSVVLIGAAMGLCAVLSMSLPTVWQQAFNILFGLCLVTSPWVLGFSVQAVPAINAVLVGLMVIVTAVGALAMESDLQHGLHEHHGVR